MAIIEVNYESLKGENSYTRISGYPDCCPACNRGMGPRKLGAYETSEGWCKNILIVFQCPLEKCKSIFVGYYSANDKLSQYFVLKRNIVPIYTESSSVPENVKKVSAKFSRIFWQATAAEESGLEEICGSGYRRALEFLVKDYLISQFSDDQSKRNEIEKLPLGECIKQIPDDKIKAVSKRAAWLGNDETHYYRKWDEMDIKNLKQLIQLTIYWIDASESTANYLKQMPD